MYIEDIFNNYIFPELKEYVVSKSLYNPKLVKGQPLESKVFPIVPIKLLPIENKYSNLSYGEIIISFGLDINIYAQDNTYNGVKTSKKTICDEITKLIIEYFKQYHLSIKVEYDIANIDSNIYRNNIRIMGKVDTKYGENNLVIYP